MTTTTPTTTTTTTTTTTDLYAGVHMLFVQQHRPNQLLLRLQLLQLLLLLLQVQTCMLESTRYLYSNTVQVNSAWRQTAQLDWVLLMITGRISCRHYRDRQTYTERYTHRQTDSDVNKSTTKTRLRPRLDTTTQSKVLPEP